MRHSEFCANRSPGVRKKISSHAKIRLRRFSHNDDILSVSKSLSRITFVVCDSSRFTCGLLYIAVYTTKTSKRILFFALNIFHSSETNFYRVFSSFIGVCFYWTPYVIMHLSAGAVGLVHGIHQKVASILVAVNSCNV